MTDDTPAETLRSRADSNRLTMWVLLDGDRRAVVGLVLAVVFTSLTALAVADPAGIRAAMTDSYPIETTFQALVGGIITGVTLVVSINSLVLSQELGAVGDQRNRMEEAMSFRRELESKLDMSTMPADPAKALREIVETVRDRAAVVQDTAADCPDPETRETVTEFLDTLDADAATASERLAGTEFGSFETVRAALEFGYAENIHRARLLRNEHRDALPSATLTALDDLLDALILFGPTREHIKTLYFQWELINLSRVIAYAAIPALVVAIGAIFTLDNLGTVPGSTLGLSNLAWLAIAGATVSLTPFLLLLVYIVRLATVAKRTLAIGPFVLTEE